MNIKELLLEGCVIQMSYKRLKEQWVGNVQLYIFSGGFGMSPKICINGDIGSHEFALDQIDIAVEFFKQKVFCAENLWYKHNEALIQISKANPDIDLEEEEDFELYERIRLELVSKVK